MRVQQEDGVTIIDFDLGMDPSFSKQNMHEKTKRKIWEEAPDWTDQRRASTLARWSCTAQNDKKTPEAMQKLDVIFNSCPRVKQLMLSPKDFPASARYTPAHLTKNARLLKQEYRTASTGKDDLLPVCRSGITAATLVSKYDKQTKFELTNAFTGERFSTDDVSSAAFKWIDYECLKLAAKTQSETMPTKEHQPRVCPRL